MAYSSSFGPWSNSSVTIPIRQSPLFSPNYTLSFPNFNSRSIRTMAAAPDAVVGDWIPVLLSSPFGGDYKLVLSKFTDYISSLRELSLSVAYQAYQQHILSRKDSGNHGEEDLKNSGNSEDGGEDLNDLDLFHICLLFA
ncbi:hypothetical protein COLO4_31299 [Corchorus olitorius]|uniref:Uncharacterized protein n=1 Tax=Corchorus olitorius TaxID=93759 RepID=A0A1R3H4V0_9ROSI|nr:hypothetical protein COLO4_31299 [Corchorus olitorius]